MKRWRAIHGQSVQSVKEYPRHKQRILFIQIMQLYTLTSLKYEKRQKQNRQILVKHRRHNGRQLKECGLDRLGQTMLYHAHLWWDNYPPVNPIVDILSKPFRNHGPNALIHDEMVKKCKLDLYEFFWGLKWNERIVIAGQRFGYRLHTVSVYLSKVLIYPTLVPL